MYFPKLRKILLKDALGICLLFTGSLAVGMVTNDLRPSPLALTYAPPQDRLNDVVAEIQAESDTSPQQPIYSDVTLEEMENIVSAASATILDARPEVFYKFGHIPTALSLPRDDFKIHYDALKLKLSALKDAPIIVYCASSDCQDSQLVADALKALGYTHVRVFRGGWAEWKSVHNPEANE